MEAYVERLVTEYHLDNAPISHTPLPTSVLKLEKRDPTDKADSGTVKQYQSLVAKLLYPTLHRLGFSSKPGSTIATILSYSARIYRVNTPILNTTAVQSVNIPHMRTVH
jgi:hypothetical protein